MEPPGIPVRFSECRALDAGTDWTTEELLRLAEEMKEAGIQGVFVGGGEPFLRRDIWQVLEAFHGRGLCVSTITNGSLPRVFDDNGLHVLDRCVGAIDISIDSAIPEEHNALRGTPRAYHLGMETLERLARLTRTRRTLRAVITRLNYRQLDLLVPLAAKYGCAGLEFQPVTDSATYPPLSPKVGKKDLLLSAADVTELSVVLRRAGERARETGLRTNAVDLVQWAGRYFVNRSEGRASHDGLINRLYCRAASDRVTIGHDGRVSLCAIIPTEDSARRSSLGQILATPNRQRESVCKGNLLPGCRDCFCALELNVGFSARVDPIRNFRFSVADFTRRLRKFLPLGLG